MYTSFESNEPRFSSPGRFVLAVVNPPSSDTTMSISLNWNVAFQQPSLEYTIEEDAIYVLEEDARLKITDFTAGKTFDPYLRKGIATTGDGTAYLSPEDFTPVLPPGVMLRLPHPKSLNSDTGASGAPENAIVTHLGVSPSDATKIAYFLSRNDVDYVQLTAAFPFSIAPVTDPICKKGTVYEEDVLESGNDIGVLARSARAPRSLTSAPALRQSSKGKLLSFQNSKRF